MKQMRLISIHEPWATLMALSLKRIETRDWATSWRGPLAIHASKHGMSLEETLATCMQPTFYQALQAYPPFAAACEMYSDRPTKQAMKAAFPERGKILAVVNLVRCVPTETIVEGYIQPFSQQERAFGNYEPLRFGWLTELVFRLPEPLAFSSRQGLVDVPADVRQELARQWRNGAVHTSTTPPGAFHSAAPGGIFEEARA